MVKLEIGCKVWRYIARKSYSVWSNTQPSVEVDTNVKPNHIRQITKYILSKVGLIRVLRHLKLIIVLFYDPSAKVMKVRRRQTAHYIFTVCFGKSYGHMSFQSFEPGQLRSENDMQGNMDGFEAKRLWGDTWSQPLKCICVSNATVHSASPSLDITLPVGIRLWSNHYTSIVPVISSAIDTNKRKYIEITSITDNH